MEVWVAESGAAVAVVCIGEGVRASGVGAHEGTGGGRLQRDDVVPANIVEAGRERVLQRGEKITIQP